MTVTSRRWWWRRLRAMPAAEIAYRVVVVARDRARRRVAPRQRGARALRHGGGSPDNGIAPSPLFWWGRGDVGNLQPALESCCPGAAAAVCRAADRILSGEALLFGEWVTVGFPPDWHRDPVSGGVFPRCFGGEIDLRATGPGSVRRVWELGRHHGLVALAQAYALTGEERYAAGLGTLWEDWLATNPRGAGIHWTSGLEMAVRAASWACAWGLLQRGDALPEATAARLSESLAAQGQWIWEHPSLYSSSNNHRIGEAAALAALGMLWPGLPQASRRRTHGMRSLEREVLRQIAPDGVSREQAFHYQAFVLDTCLWVIDLARRSGVSIRAPFLERVRAAARFLRWVIDEKGGLPAIGDSDDGWMLRFAGAGDSPYRGLLQVAAVTFRDGALDPEGDEPDPLLFWRLGLEGISCWRDLRPARASCPSRLVARGGYAVMRADSECGERVAVFDCGPLGLLPLAAHGHADALALTISVGGRPALIDAGTYGYHEQPEWRPFFRGTRAHNTVTVDGRDQSEPGGPFLWRRAARVELERWASSPAIDVVRASHDGYSGQGVVHRRTVAFRKPDTWIVVDEILGSGEHLVEQRFLLAPGDLQAAPERLRVAADRLAVAAAPVPGLSCRVVAGSEEPREGWYSPRFGCRLPAPVVLFEWSGTLPVTFVTVLSAGEAPDEVERLPAGAGALAVRLAYGSGTEWAALAAPGAAFNAGPFAGKGELAWLRLGSDGEPEWLGGLHLREVSWRGRLLHDGEVSVLDSIVLGC